MPDRRSFIEDACLGTAAATLFSRAEETDSLRTVPTIEALRAEPLRAGDVVFVAGYHQPGDGGGGLFYGDEDAACQRSGMAIPPEDGGGKGRWIRWQSSEEYDIRAFGAHPDQEDNASAIQDCLDTAADSGGTVHVPAGEYQVSRPLVMAPNVSVQGEGMNSVIQKTTHASGPSLRRALPNREAVDEYNVDCILAVDRPNTDVKFSHDIEIREIRLQGHANRTGSVTERNSYGLYAPRLLRAQIDGVTIEDVQAGFHFKGIIVSQINNCWASRVETGFEIPDPGTGGGTSLTLTGCYASKVDRWGYYLRGLSYSTLVGCACDNVNQEGSGGGYFFGVCHGITLSSCGCEATVAPVLKVRHSEVVANGLKTFDIQGGVSQSAYVEAKNATLQMAGCRLPDLRAPGQTRNGQYEQGTEVTYVNGDRPSGGRSALVDESSSVLCIGERATEMPDAAAPDVSIQAEGIGFGDADTMLAPEGVDIDGSHVLQKRQPPIGELVDASEGTASRRVESVQGESDVSTINDNFATLCRQLERIRTLLGEGGHGLTRDDPDP
jgi:hypothetical protein